jgi:diguanylate cyclase (GGDEF)-like protein
MRASPPAARPRAVVRLSTAAALLVWLLVALVVGPAPAAAQDLQFRHLGVDDGLPSSLVSDVLQDRRGFMWIGTAHGVSRYDGHQFHTYGHERGNPSSLPLSFVDQVYEDRRGTLWVVTAAGVSRYDPARDGFVTYMTRDAAPAGLAPSQRIVTRAVEDRRGAFWVGTSTGLYRFDRRTGTATAVSLAAAGGPAAGGPASPHVTAVYEDRRARLWVGTRAGLYQLDSASRTPRRYVPDPADPTSLPDSVVRTIAEDAAGTLWVGTNYGGLARWDAGPHATDAGRFTRFRHDPADPHSLARDRVIRVVAERAGPGLWVGTENGGLDHFDPATGRFAHHRYDPNAPSGIGSNSIWALYHDAAGTLWVGTFSGGLDVSRPNGAAIQRYRSVPGDATSLSYNAVPTFAEDRAGYVWVGTDGGGLNRFDPRTRRFARYTEQNTNLNAEAVLDVLEDRRGALWVATWGGGISRFDRRSRRFTAYTTRTAASPTTTSTSCSRTAAGGCGSGRTTRRSQSSTPGAARSPAATSWSAGAGAVVGGAPARARRRDLRRRAARGGADPPRPRDGRAAAPRERPAAPDQPGRQQGARAARGRRRARARRAVGRHRGGAGPARPAHRPGHAHGPADGLPSDYVVGIERDGAGRLWVSTDRGLGRYDPRRGTFKTYTRADGLQGNEFLMRSSFRARDGTLYFGGNTGFSAVRPDRVVDNTRRPPVVLTGLELFNVPVAAGAPGSPLRLPIGETAELTLTHAQNVVTFGFAALDFTAPEKTRYAYRIDGFDAGWQEVGHQRAASYTNLAPGRYTFACGRARRRRVERDGASLALVVTPPVWQRGGSGCSRRPPARSARRPLALPAAAAGGGGAGPAGAARLAHRAGEPRALPRPRRARAGARGARGPGAAGRRPRVAVLFLDLDDFKTVNDSLGHHAGDRLLRAVAARLLNATRGCDTVARFGGDEFAVLLENARGAADAVTVAERFLAALRAPFAVGAAGDAAGAREARVGASVGVAFAAPGVDADTLLRQADAAMYQAKAQGKGRQAVFHPSLVAAADERLASRPTSRARSGAASSPSPTSRSSPSTRARCAASRRCCAGTTPRAARCRRPSSSPWPRRRG